MPRAIDHDVKRFNEIVRGRIRKDLRKYINHGEMLGRRGRERTREEEALRMRAAEALQFARLLLVLDGEWRDEDLVVLSESGWDEFIYPDEMERLAQLVG